MVHFQEKLQKLKQSVDERLMRLTNGRSPRSLYEPIRYVFRSGGKRVRPLLTLLSCEAVGGRSNQAIDGAVAIEILHSFTLVHDDIMDNADTRRGQITVHKRWDSNTAILAGDEMVALAYESLLNSRHPRLGEIVRTFTKAFTDVCEGQGLDEEFGRRTTVSIREYLQMIDKKTAALLSGAAAIGAVIGRGSKREVAALAAYGRHLGRAFQMRDDVLDVTADAEAWGKSIGGDLKEGKKTYLLIRAIERTRGRERALLQRTARRRRITEKEIGEVKKIFHRNGILNEARVAMRRNTMRAQDALQSLNPATPRSHQAKDILAWLSEELMERKF